MIDVQNTYTKFWNDIQADMTSINPLVIIGWDAETSSPKEGSILVAEQKQRFDGYYFEDYDLKIPSIKESTDFESRKFKISNMTLKLSNYPTPSGERFSDLLAGKTMINEVVKILWASPSCSSISDCLPLYHGTVRRLNHDEKSVTIQMEDLSQAKLHKDLPSQKVELDEAIPEKYHNVFIPMVYGVNELSPAVVTSNDGSAIKIQCDSKQLAGQSINKKTISDGTEPILVDNCVLKIQINGSEDLVEIMEKSSYVQGRVEIDGEATVFPSSGIEQYSYSNNSCTIMKEFNYSGDSLDNASKYIITGYIFKPVTNLIKASSYYMPNYTTTIEPMNDVRFENIEDGVANIYDGTRSVWHLETSEESYSDHPPPDTQLYVHDAVFQVPKPLITVPFIDNYIRPQLLFDFKYLGESHFVGDNFFANNVFVYMFNADYTASGGVHCGLNLFNTEPVHVGNHYKYIWNNYNDSEIIEGESSYTTGAGTIYYLQDLEFNTNIKSETSGFITGLDYKKFTKLGIYDNFKIRACVQPFETTGNSGEVDFDIEQMGMLYMLVVPFSQDANFYMNVRGRINVDSGGNHADYTVNGGGLIEKPCDIILHILKEELNFKNETYAEEIEKAREAHSFWKFGFSIKEKTNSKKLIERIASQSMLFPKFRGDGSFGFNTIKPTYNQDEAITIPAKHVNKLNINKTKLEDIKTKVAVNYKQNYHLDNFARKTQMGINDPLMLGSNYDFGFYGLSDIDPNTSEESHADSTLEIDADLIRDKSTAEKLRNFLLYWYCQQHLTFSFQLPLKYLYLEQGDIIRFDELINNYKAYGVDYTKIYKLNGQWIYPAFMVNSITKSTKGVKIKAIQMHYLGNDDQHGWVEEPITGCLEEVDEANGMENWNYNPNADEAGDCHPFGDVNNDGVLNVLDIIAVVNEIIDGGTMTETQRMIADSNKDGVVNIVDIIRTINAIMYETTIEGCTDNQAINYDSTANSDDGSCEYDGVAGCTDENAINYNPNATVDDGSCELGDPESFIEINFDLSSIVSTQQESQNFMVFTGEIITTDTSNPPVNSFIWTTKLHYNLNGETIINTNEALSAQTTPNFLIESLGVITATTLSNVVVCTECFTTNDDVNQANYFGFYPDGNVANLGTSKPSWWDEA